MFATLFQLAHRWPKLLLALSTLILVGAGVYGAGVFGDLTSEDGFSIPGTESHEVAEIIGQNFNQSQISGVILFSSNNSSLKAEDTAFKAKFESIVASFDPQPTQLVSYFSTGQTQFISKDKTKTYTLVTFAGDDDQQVAALRAIQDSASTEDVTVDVGGQLLSNHQATKQVEKDLQQAELISLPILALLLLFFFRSPIAALLPIILGIMAIAGGLGIVRALTHVTEIDQYSVNVITILGLGLAVDYSLLMVNRFKEELHSGVDATMALRRTVLTSGRTIFFSGITVMTCLLILSLFPIGFLRSVGLGGASALLVAVVAALTALPALLSLLGHNVTKWTIGRKPAQNQEEHSIWIKTGAFTLRHPVTVLLVSAAIILAIAAPFRHVNFTTLDYRSLASNSSSYRVSESLTNDFRGQSPAVSIIYRLDNPTSSEGIAAIYELTRQLAAIDEIEQVESPTPITPQSSPQQYQLAYAAGQLPAELQALQQRYIAEDVVLLNAHLQSGLSGRDEQRLVDQIRGLRIERGEVLVGGMAALLNDSLSIIGQYLPWAIGVMAVVIFVLFTLLLQSIVIPLKTIVINAFTLLAAFGILTLIFQDGWLTEQTWLSHTQGMQPTIPILIFAVAFGLSMDYAAFLYGRMHEEYEKTKDNDRAVLTSLDKTGGIITAAAILLFVVVSAFATSKIAIIQQVGFGLAVAVLLDAFVIRMFLVPAVMKLLGNLNWYAPRWLKRWHIRHE